MNIQTVRDGERFALLINGKTLGEYYQSLGIRCSAGQVYFYSKAEALKQAITEIEWHRKQR